MGTRVTIDIDLMNDRKIHTLQSKIIEETGKGCSYSNVVNLVLKRVVK